MGCIGSAGSGRGRRGPREPRAGSLDPAGRLRQHGLFQVTRPQGPWEPVMLELGKARRCKHGDGLSEGAGWRDSAGHVAESSLAP